MTLNSVAYTICSVSFNLIFRFILILKSLIKFQICIEITDDCVISHNSVTNTFSSDKKYKSPYSFKEAFKISVIKTLKSALLKSKLLLILT